MYNNNHNQILPSTMYNNNQPITHYIVTKYPNDNAGGQVQRNVERATAIRSHEVKHELGTTRYVERLQIRLDHKIEHTPSSSSSSNRSKRSSGSGHGSRRSGGSSHYYW